MEAINVMSFTEKLFGLFLGNSFSAHKKVDKELPQIKKDFEDTILFLKEAKATLNGSDEEWGEIKR